MQVLLVERVDLLREVGPVQRSSEFSMQSLLVALRTFLGELDFPPEEVVEQTHVGLNEDGQTTGSYNEVRVDQRDVEVLHDIRNLPKVIRTLNEIYP